MQDSQLHGPRHGEDSNCERGPYQLLRPLRPRGRVGPRGQASLRVLQDQLDPMAGGQRGAACGGVHH